jgi:DNA modification methylase
MCKALCCSFFINPLQPKRRRDGVELEVTTLWDYPTQSYGRNSKGNNKFNGVTPAFVIWNLVQRYTKPGDLVVDCMAGSGTTIDVAKEEKRRAIGYDVAPCRYDIIQNDARHLPLPDNSVDMHFIDSPYSDNIRYSDHPDCIGKISCEDPRFFEELEKVAKEIHRTLKLGKVVGWLIADNYQKRKFTAVGFKLYNILCKYFETADIIVVVSRNHGSFTPLWKDKAKEYNFFLRGFKYLLIMRKR